MAANGTKAIQELLDQVGRLRTDIQTAGNEGRSKLNDIKIDEVCKEVPRGADGKLDDQAWSALPGDKQKELYDRVVQIRDSLHVIASFDGPSNPKHLMSGTYASSLAVGLWTLVAFLLVVFLLRAVVTRWDQATSTDFAPRIRTAMLAVERFDSIKDLANVAANEAMRKAASIEDESSQKAALKEVEVRTKALHAKVDSAEIEAGLATIAAIRAITKEGATEKMVLLMVTLLGALGGSLHLVVSLVRYIGNRQLKRSWLPFYLSLPLVGAALAPIIYMLLRVGLLTPSGAANGGSQTADLNLIGIYAFAAMTGMFAKTATDKLSEVFSTIFRTAERTAKDPIGPEKPPGKTTQAGGDGDRGSN